MMAGQVLQQIKFFRTLVNVERVEAKAAYIS